MQADTVRTFALKVIETDSLEHKLAPPPRDLDDSTPGPALRMAGPARPAELAIVHARKVKVPPVPGMMDPVQRARILHAMANHELQAVELFAWALLAFPDMPQKFRRGLVAILGDEQRHARLYIERLTELGAGFGEYPVTGHFWNKIEDVKTPLEFVCTMGLTFENANLDFAVEYAEWARKAGDEKTAEILEIVHADEIRHVRFAWLWLRALKEPGASEWDTYLGNIAWPLTPARARGKHLDVASRKAAGLDDEFIDHLHEVLAKRPNGEPR